jgi:branched-chain amino acid transport system substrate-binding protein
MKKSIIYVIAGVVVVLAVAASLLVLPTLGPRRQAPSEIVVGAALPMSGSFSQIGLYFKNGFELYFDEVNSKGGVYVKEFDKRIPIKLIVLDDESDTTKSAAQLERLITVEKVHLILGGYSTPLVQAQAPVAERYKMPYINPGGATSTIFLTEDGKRRYQYMFGLIASIKNLALTSIEMLKQEINAGRLPKPLKIASVNENTDHGREYLAGLKEGAKKYPGYFEVVYEAFYNIGDKDYTAVLTAIKQSGANAMLNDMRLGDYITMQRQYKTLGLCNLVVSYGPRGPEGRAISELGAAAENVFGVQWWNPADPRPEVAEFNKKWDGWVKARNLNLPSDWFAAISYEAARTLVWAIEKSGSIDPEKVYEALKALNGPANGLKPSVVVGGSIYFSDEAGGQITNPFVVVQVQNGKPVIVYPKDSATGAFKANTC